MDSQALYQPSNNAALSIAPRQQRRSYRYQMQSLAYFNLDTDNGGIIHNLGEGGIALQAVAPLRINQDVFLRFNLASPRLRMEARARVAWVGSMGRAGVQFLSVPQRSRCALKEWIFIQLLTLAHRATNDSILVDGINGHNPAELLFSSSARPTIRFEPPVTNVFSAEDSCSRRSMNLPWLPFGISPAVLCRLVDGLILLSAVLLFAIVSMALIGRIPAWPIAVVFGIGVTGIIVLLYWLLFSWWIGGTPGSCLARLTADRGVNQELNERPRFR